MPAPHRSSSDRPHPPHDRPHIVPPAASTFALSLFLAALGMLFGASMLLYLVFRLTAAHAPPPGAITLPVALWFSTAVILASSYTMHVALRSVRHERQARFRSAMTVTLLLALAFLVIQAPSVALLLEEHRAANEVYQGQREAYEQWERLHRDSLVDAEAAPPSPMFPVFGLVMFMIAVHAAHVVGGLAPMVVITAQALRGRYDHEQHAPVRLLSIYWHFLDIVWLLMFVLFLALR